MNDLTNGMVLGLDGTPWDVVGVQRIESGKGGASVRTTSGGVLAGTVVGETLDTGVGYGTRDGRHLGGVRS